MKVFKIMSLSAVVAWLPALAIAQLLLTYPVLRAKHTEERAV